MLFEDENCYVVTFTIVVGNISILIDTNIFRYIVEALDRTLGNDWHQVAEAGPADRAVSSSVATKHLSLIV